MQGQIVLPPFKGMVRLWIIGLFSIWLIGQVILDRFLSVPFTSLLALTPGQVLMNGYLWQVITYQFLHAQEVSHILLNLMMIWFIGGELEKLWGPKFFNFFMVGSGTGAGLLYLVGSYLWYMITGQGQSLIIPVVGISGAVFGLLLAYGIIYGDRTFYFMMLFPIQARYFVMILGGVELLTLITSGVGGSSVANLAHLGGLVSGFTILSISAQLKRRKKAGTQQKNHLKIVVDNENTASGKKRYWN